MLTYLVLQAHYAHTGLAAGSDAHYPPTSGEATYPHQCWAYTGHHSSSVQAHLQWSSQMRPQPIDQQATDWRISRQHHLIVESAEILSRFQSLCHCSSFFFFFFFFGGIHSLNGPRSPRLCFLSGGEPGVLFSSS